MTEMSKENNMLLLAQGETHLPHTDSVTLLFSVLTLDIGTQQNWWHNHGAHSAAAGNTPELASRHVCV